MSACEVNFDGLVGPTHHYGGLAAGNVASAAHRHETSSPRAAALQGLEKMKLVADLGVKQAVLPPHERPDVNLLRRLGFAGRDAEVLERAGRDAPDLLSAAASASAMWAANAATVSPSADADDGRVHVTPANLAGHLHRSLEPAITGAVLRRIFADERRFAHHEPLPATPRFCDEGAANHLRLAPRHGAPGFQVFAYGRDERRDEAPFPGRFPARQSLDASMAIARLHGVSNATFLRQSPAAIDAGAFHTDVVAVANERVLLAHAQTFAGGERALSELRRRYQESTGEPLSVLEISPAELSLERAVACYLFNSQLVTVPTGRMMLLCPEECREDPAAAAVVRDLVAGENPIAEVRYVSLRQSMQNGGGPACLRLRVVLTEAELGSCHPGVFFDDRLHRELRTWIERHHREELHPRDLADPRLLTESREALDEVTGILGLGSLYAFQRA